jgi:methionyl aminopeptidase
VNDNNKTQIKPGMILAIEPFATNGQGKIKASKPGNIYKIAQERPIADIAMKEFYDSLVKEFVSFPFCERWIDHPKASSFLNKLTRHGLLTVYAQLVEMKRGCVTQSEHTVYIDEKNTIITTLL